MTLQALIASIMAAFAALTGGIGSSVPVLANIVDEIADDFFDDDRWDDDDWDDDWDD